VNRVPIDASIYIDWVKAHRRPVLAHIMPTLLSSFQAITGKSI
jgi:hypothetical protein